jgi:hypothetical protein
VWFNNSRKNTQGTFRDLFVHLNRSASAGISETGESVYVAPIIVDYSIGSRYALPNEVTHCFLVADFVEAVGYAYRYLLSLGP